MENLNTKIGLVGLGIIGSSILKNIHSAGQKSSGFDIDENSMIRLNSEGFETTESIDRLFESSNILITSLPSSKALDETIDALISNKKSGIEVVIETSTLSLECKLRNEEKAKNVGIEVLDCPISGTGKQADTAYIVLYASCSEETYKKVLSVLGSFSKEAFFLGDYGNGTKVKLIANLLVSIHNVASAEAIRLGEESGLDLEKLYQVISSGAGTSKIFELRAPMMIEREYLPATMKMDVWSKDMSLIREMINDIGIDSPLFEKTDELYAKAKDHGLEHMDTASIFEPVSYTHLTLPTNREV